jgi:hypothetical protein
MARRLMGSSRIEIRSRSLLASGLYNLESRNAYPSIFEPRKDLAPRLEALRQVNFRLSTRQNRKIAIPFLWPGSVH